jgi:hypothetical protein
VFRLLSVYNNIRTVTVANLAIFMLDVRLCVVSVTWTSVYSCNYILRLIPVALSHSSQSAILSVHVKYERACALIDETLTKQHKIINLLISRDTG